MTDQDQSGRQRQTVHVVELRLPAVTTKLLVVSGSIVLIVILGVLLLLFRPWNKNSSSSRLPAAITQQVSGRFTPYYIADNAVNYSLVPGSASFSHGVLIFALQNPQGTKLTVTEQSLPQGYNVSQLMNGSPTLTKYGQTKISAVGQSQTAGTLVTNDQTWVIVSSLTAIGSDQMQQILDALAPTH